MAAISPVEFLFSPSNTNGIQKTGTLSAPRSNIHFSSGTGAVKTDFYSMEYNLYTAGSTFAVVHLTNRKLLSLILIKKHSYTQKEGKRERERKRERRKMVTRVAVLKASTLRFPIQLPLSLSDGPRNRDRGNSRM